MRISGLLQSVWLLVLMELIKESLAWNSPTSRRRTLFDCCAGVVSATIGVQSVSGAQTGASIAERIESTILNIPPPSYSSELNGVDNLYFPPWMEGEWQVTQTLTDVKTPLGMKFVGGPNGSEKIAVDTMTEAKQKLGIPVNLRLRYINTKWGVAEDRLFNSKQRLDAFAGKPVVAAVDYANVGGSNRQTVLALGGTETDPLQTTVLRFRGPAAQKTFVTSHGQQMLDSNTWAGYELDRSIFALTNQNTAPPLTTDQELIWKLKRLDEDTVVANFRIAGYLNAQSDMLFFEARNRAVSIQDYMMEFKRTKE